MTYRLQQQLLLAALTVTDRFERAHARATAVHRDGRERGMETVEIMMWTAGIIVVVGGLYLVFKTKVNNYLNAQVLPVFK